MIIVSQLRTKDSVHMAAGGHLGTVINAKQHNVEMKYTELGIVIRGVGQKKGAFAIVPLSNVIVADIDEQASNME